METLNRVRTDYKPKERVRPLFYQQKKRQSKLKLLAVGAFGAIGLSQLLTHFSSSTASPVLNQTQTPIVEDVIELPQIIPEPKIESSPLEPISQLHWSNLEVKSGDSLTTLFRKAKILPAELSAALNIG